MIPVTINGHQLTQAQIVLLKKLLLIDFVRISILLNNEENNLTGFNSIASMRKAEYELMEMIDGRMPPPAYVPLAADSTWEDEPMVAVANKRVEIRHRLVVRMCISNPKFSAIEITSTPDKEEWKVFNKIILSDNKRK